MQEAALVAADLSDSPVLRAQVAEFIEIASKLGFTLRQQCEKSSPQLRVTRVLGRPVVHEVPIPEALEQVRRNQLLEVLGNPRLAQAGHPGQLRHTALRRTTQRNQPQPDRIGQGLELRQQFARRSLHIKL